MNSVEHLYRVDILAFLQNGSDQLFVTLYTLSICTQTADPIIPNPFLRYTLYFNRQYILYYIYVCNKYVSYDIKVPGALWG